MIEQPPQPPSETERIRRLVGEICSLEDPNQLEMRYRQFVVMFGQRIRVAEHSWQEILRMVETKLKRPDGLFFRTLNELVIKIYTQGSQLVHILYECLPELLIKFQSYLQLGAEEKENNQRLKGNQQVNAGIDAVVLNIYNYELPSYSLYVENIKVTELPQLTRIFGEVEMVRQSYAPEKQVTFSNKFRLVCCIAIQKSFLLFVYYHHILQLSDNSIHNFFKLIYVLCGGNGPPEKFSLYMLNSPEEFSLFLHRISDQEFEWLLLAVYYIYVQKKHLKFEVIAAVNLIVRKCGNQCKFKLTETGLSLLDLFENEYENVF